MKKKFSLKGTYTIKVDTINKDGYVHITPIWFILDEMDISNLQYDINHKNFIT